jgi:hypothetical protein
MVVPRAVAVLALVVAAPVADAGVRCSRCVVTVGGAKMVMTGEVSPKLDVTVRSDRWPLSGVELRNVEITVHEGASGYRACATARVAAAKIDACGTIAHGFAEVRDVTWTAKAKKWSVQGTATVGKTGDVVADVVVAAGDVKVPIAIHANLFSGKVTSATATALGGELAIEPTKLRWPLDLTVHAKGLALAGMLPELIRGTGLVDGDLALRVDGDGVTIASAELHARTSGELRVADTSWLPRTSFVHQRVATMLNGFAYDHLSATIAPPGRDPEGRLLLHGRDKTSAQELDLVVRLHGARDVAQRLLDRVWRSS